MNIGRAFYFKSWVCYKCQVGYSSIIIYFFSLFSATATIFLSYRLARKYPLRYLGSYLYFQVSFYILAFIKLLLTYLAPDLFSDNSIELNIHILMLFFIFPLIPVCIYFFLDFITGFLEKKLSRFFIKTYVLFWVLIDFGIVVGMKFYLDNTGIALLRITSLIYLMAVIALLILIFSQIVFVDKNKLAREKRIAVNVFSALYALGLILYLFVIVKFSNPISGSVIEFMLLFSLNFPPLIFLIRFLSQYHLDHPIPTKAEPDWQAISAKFNISRRECEIMRLLLNGRSNRDIEAALFISIKTVKNHISHIYKKLNIKNRIQLINLVNNFSDQEWLHS